jgi:hypothetical protein
MIRFEGLDRVPFVSIEELIKYHNPKDGVLSKDTEGDVIEDKLQGSMLLKFASRMCRDKQYDAVQFRHKEFHQTKNNYDERIVVIDADKFFVDNTEMFACRGHIQEGCYVALNHLGRAELKKVIPAVKPVPVSEESVTESEDIAA